MSGDGIPGKPPSAPEPRRSRAGTANAENPVIER
jgi:hypothetical protein